MEFKTTRNLLVGAVAAAMSAGAVAQMEYNDITRGFMLEHAGTQENRKASIDLSSGPGGGMGPGTTSGAGAADLSSGFRLGLPNSELILNHARLRGIGAAQNEMVLKVGLNPIDIDNDIVIDWAAYGGISHFDPDEGDSVTNFGGGLAMTANIDNFILNFNPEMVFDDAAEDDADDIFFNLGFGAHYRFGDTNIGQFQPGAEVRLTTRDNTAGDSIDPRMMIGVRWLYNEQVTLDIVPMNFGAGTSGRADSTTDDGVDLVGLPGFVRLNVAF